MRFATPCPEKTPLVFVLGLWLAACGGSGSSPGGPANNNNNATTYNLTIDDADGGCDVAVDGVDHGVPSHVVVTETAGSTVTLVASPTSSADTFGAWTGTTSNYTATTTVVMSSDAGVTVSCPAASAGPFTLTLNNADGQCQMSVNGTAYSAPVTVAAGTIVTLDASGASGFSFDGWSGDVVSAAASTMVTMNADKAVIASCSAVPSHFTLTIDNYLAWCSVTSSDATLSSATASVITASVSSTSATVHLHGAALTYFHWVNAGENGGWYGPIEGGSADAANQDVTVTLSANTTIGVCCPATATDCPAAGTYP